MRGADHTSRLSSVLTVLMAVVALALAWGHASNVTLARASVAGAKGPIVADSLAGGAVLTATNMVPGDVITGEVTVSNAGDSAGDMTLGVDNIADATARGGVLSQILDLTVLDVTPGRTQSVVYAGRLNGLHDAALGSFEQGDWHRYRFVVTFPGGRPDFADDLFQGASSRVSFIWTATQSTDEGGQGGGGQSGGGQGGGGQGGGGPGPAPGAPAEIIEDHVEKSRDPGYLKLRIYVRRTQAAHRRRVYVNVFCSHGCRLTATGVVSLPSQKKKWRIKALRGSVKRAGTVKFRMPLPPKALRPLNTALLHRKRASVKLKITATSGVQTLRWTRTIRLAR